MKYDAASLVIHPQLSATQTGLVTTVTPARAGWTHLSFEVHRLAKDTTWKHNTGQNEYGLVILGGVCSIDSNRGNWARIGQRANVFDGMPFALYLPRHTEFTVTAHTEGFEIAAGWAATDRDREPKLVTPAESAVEIRGSGSATRQINSLFPPGFGCDRIVGVEVYTPSGNWSSYPPHKHDVHRVDTQGRLLEADLEEIYYYKIDRPEGFAFQRVYTGDASIDSVVLAHNDDVVLIPEGYHPVSAPPGYNVYYLNFLAGSAQSLASVDDPAYAWIKSTWQAMDKDPRVPVVSLATTR